MKTNIASLGEAGVNLNHRGRRGFRPTAAVSACVALSIFLWGALPSVASADGVEDFYKGKKIRLICSSSPGGLYDTFSRLMSRHWGKYIPGQPVIVVENMPGAGGLIAANFVANSAPRDGTVIAGVQSNVPTADALGMDGVRFKGTDLSWIGSISREAFIAYVYKTAPIQTLEDALTKEVVFGGTALGSASVDMAVIAKKLFGLRLKIVPGYPGGTESRLAMERGEIHGIFATGWGALKADQPEWVRDKTIRIVVQHGLARHPELPDVPLLLDWAKTTEDKQLLEILMARTAFAKPYFAPPGMPAERLAALRRAFDQMMVDKDFLADARNLNADPDGPMTGEEIAATIAKLSETPPSVVDRINSIFAEFKAGKL